MVAVAMSSPLLPCSSSVVSVRPTYSFPLTKNNSRLVAPSDSNTGTKKTTTIMLQGASVKMGARLEASKLTISRVEVVGVSARDENSSLKLTACMCQKHSRRYRDRGVVRGIHIHTNSTAELLSTTVGGSSMCCGVDVSTNAKATLSGCTVRDTSQGCVQFRSGGIGRIEDCVISGSRTRQGLCVQGTCKEV